MNERYAAAERLLSPVALPTVRNAAVTVRWLGSSNECRYRRETGDGHEWLIVDAAQNSRRPAFDRRQLAQALNALGHEVAAAKLGIDVGRIDDDAVEFSFKQGRYVLPIGCGEVKRLADLELAKGPSRSPDGRWALSQHEGNLWLAEGGRVARQLTTDGSLDDGYAIYHGNYKGCRVPRSRADPRGPPAGVVWAPDSSKLIVWRIEQRHVESYPMLEPLRTTAASSPRYICRTCR